MKHSCAFVLMLAVVIAASALSGCTSPSTPATPAAGTPVPVDTALQPPAVATPPPTTVPGPDTGAADKNFVDALDGCYAQTPALTNISTRVTFTECLMQTPDPRGICAVNYKNNIRRFLKGDDTTAGYAMANNGMRMAKAAYQQGMTYDFVNDKNVGCAMQPLGYPLT